MDDRPPLTVWRGREGGRYVCAILELHAETLDTPEPFIAIAAHRAGANDAELIAVENSDTLEHQAKRAAWIAAMREAGAVELHICRVRAENAAERAEALEQFAYRVDEPRTHTAPRNSALLEIARRNGSERRKKRERESPWLRRRPSRPRPSTAAPASSPDKRRA